VLLPEERLEVGSEMEYRSGGEIIGAKRPHATCAALIPIRKTASWWVSLRTNAEGSWRKTPSTWRRGYGIYPQWPADSIAAVTE
jgi:hypothetical protein